METQNFGAKLRELRNQAGLTQRELADRVNIDFSYLSKIESGVVPPPSEKVISQLAEALNADRDELSILAGRIPPDIAQILKNGKTLQRLRSARAKQLAKSSRKRGETAATMKRLVSFNRSLSRIAIPVVLVLAVAASLWFAAPVSALTITFGSLPSGETLGDTHSFTVTVDLASAELVPIQSIDLEIYNVADDSNKATCSDLPLNNGGTKDYSNTATGGGGTVSITATSPTNNWGYFTTGAGYAYWRGQGYTFVPVIGGYGYSTGAARIRYDVTWTSPSGWPSGAYKTKATVTVTSSTPPNDTFIEISDAFTLSSVVGGGGIPRGPAPPPPGVTDVSDVVTAGGEFTADVTAESEDELVQLTIEEGTIGLVDEEPLSEISITEMEDPPAPPEDSEVIGLTYDLGPDDATFDPPITLTFTYDPDEIPEGVSEENLVIAMWDEDMDPPQWVNLDCTVDPVTNTITASVSHFTAFTAVAYTEPAAFTTTYLIILPTEVDIGEPVTIRVLATNTGDLSSSYQVVLRIDKVAVATQDVTLEGGASQKVTFTTSKDVAGTYTINVNGLTGTFTVKAPPVPPVVEPAPPVVPAPPVAPVVPPTAINWWLIGGIIAAVIIISIVAILVIRRRMA